GLGRTVLTSLGVSSQDIVNSQNLGLDRGFRMEFLGDLILDCGHEPQPTEIHPPESIVLHLSRPADAHARYSLFGSHRNPLAPLTDIVADLWPKALAPSANAFLDARGDFFGGGGSIGPIFGPLGTWVCYPYPFAAPSHLRCTLSVDLDATA